MPPPSSLKTTDEPLKATIITLTLLTKALLIKGNVDTHELLITKRLSKTPSSYNHDVFQAVAAKQLEETGFEIHAGQTVQYLIVNARSRNANERVKAAQLLRSNTHHDIEEYLNLLFSASETLLAPFGYTKERVKTEALFHEKQVLLH